MGPVLLPRQPHILLVDDDPVMRELAQARLVDSGYHVTSAENGGDGLEKLRERGADLVITDLEMPVLDGYELIRAVRADRVHNEIPIICITGSDHTDAVERVFAEGATSFLSKPINWTLFGHSVRFVLRASEAQLALRRARDEAQSGSRMKDTLMSVMSHELRTPLNAIIGFGQIIGAEFARANDEQNQKYTDYIVKGGRRLLETVSDMLLASDVFSGPLSLTEESAALCDVIDEAVRIARDRYPESAVDVEIRLQDKSLALRCDRSLLARAIAKILENSLKFTPATGRVRIGAARSKQGGLGLLIEDNGPGITPEDLKRIAEPFTQSDMSLRRSTEGLGLGLPVAKAIFAAHGAVIRITAKYGEGTRAVVALPSERLEARSTGELSSAA